MIRIEFSDSPNERGMHGSFSHIDVHNSLFALGPDFRRQFEDDLPSGNVDVAPTIAHILNLKLPNTDGRILAEALQNSLEKNYSLNKIIMTPAQSVKNLTMFNALNQMMSAHAYTMSVHVTILNQGGNNYSYFDFAKAIRQ